MTTLNRVRVEEIEGPRLRCLVDHVYRFHWTTSLVASRTLALHLLWESLGLENPGRPFGYEQAVEYRRAAPLYGAIEGARMEGHNCTDEDWNRANVGRFVSCVGVTDRRNCDPLWENLEDERWDDPDVYNRLETPRATFFIAVTDPRFLAHLAPGAEWDSTSYDHDAKFVVDPAWLTPTVVSLARGAAELAFDRLPILADALQDAGCDSDDLLNHLRDPDATHVRGCWALDLVLGKS